MANETSGEFLDPAGRLMRLVSTSPESFRILVTRKLAAGWSYAPKSPVVEPLIDESTLALPPPLPPPPYEVVVNFNDPKPGFHYTEPEPRDVMVDLRKSDESE